MSWEDKTGEQILADIQRVMDKIIFGDGKTVDLDKSEYRRMAAQPQRKSPEPEVIEACYACPALLDDPGECLGPSCPYPKFPRQMPASREQK